MNKYCRICWNTKHWHEPTGEAAKLEQGQSYVRENGFGHEEWLFNFSWLQPGPEGKSEPLFRYGFLQPIGKYLSKYQGQRFDVFLYTITPNKKRLAVGVIRELYVPKNDEIKAAHQYMRRLGWLDDMASDLSSLGSSAKIRKGMPADIINVRFQQSAVQFFDPRFILPSDHVTYRIDRYQPLDWDGTVPKALRSTGLQSRPGKAKRKSEEERTRAAIEGITYSPRHNKLQNALDAYLRDLYGQKSVYYESNFVDLQLHRGEHVIYFEIKIALTAKSCIREALGQLMEYNIYPNQQRASEMIIVGENRTEPDDKTYIEYLRQKFGIPVRYIRWDWEAGGRLDEAL